MNVARIIPLEVQSAIEHFWETGSTGQIALNFKSGMILSTDQRNHSKTETRFCGDCGLPVQRGNGFNVHRGKLRCPDCT